MNVGWRGGTAQSVAFDTAGHSDASPGWVYTNLVLTGSGGLDELRFTSTNISSYGPLLDDVSLTLLGSAEASIAGRSPILVTGNTNWQQAIIPFNALGPNTTFDIQGIDDGLIIDQVVLTEAGGPLYILPEDPYGLSTLKGTSAKGEWQLEIWDNRAGPPISRDAMGVR